MSASLHTEKTIFLEAAEIASTTERAAFLERSCGEDQQLRAAVEALLLSHQRSHGVLDLTKAPLAEHTGTIIGPYKVLQQIGEGGMGTVFMAQQTEPVQRKVALKIIKLGMDTRQIIARFEAERQALALMDHPNIAKMLEAGATNTGQPYFVMELVKGISITSYCDQHQLSTKQRLDLFLSVCSAVQHAHQKGIIHRDLKPNNVLVADYDDHPVAKIIDFGVAKAVGQSLTDRTMFTEFGQVMGTIEYMSPEQAKLNQLDIDTRTDIYSLGVLLYELLAGSTPFDKERLRSAAFDEMLRIIREEEPVNPSTRLSTSLSLPSIAANRHLEPKKLTTLVRGDLDWIVMKSLEKDRTRRYETATGLAEDIERYLIDQPVEARRPTRRYRLKKFARRNKVGVLAASAVAVALVLGLILASFGFIQARHEAIRADSEASNARTQTAHAVHEAEIAHTQAIRSEQVAKLLEDMLHGVGPSVALGRDTTMLHEIVDKTVERIATELKDQPEVEIELRKTLANVYFELYLYGKMEETARESLRLARAHFGNDHLYVADALGQIGAALLYLRQNDEAESFLHQAIALQRKLRGKDSLQEADSLIFLGDALRLKAGSSIGPETNDHLIEAESTIRAGLTIRRKLVGNDTDPVAWALHDLSILLQHENKLTEAESSAREGLAIARKIYGDEHPNTAKFYSRVGDVLAHSSIHRLNEAETYLRKALAIQKKMEGDGKLSELWTHASLAVVLEKAGKLDEAEFQAREALATARKQMDGDYPDLPRFITDLAILLRKKGNLTDARPLAEEATAIYEREIQPVDRQQRDCVFATLRDVLSDLGETAAIKALDERLSKGIELENRTPNISTPTPSPKP